MRTNKGGYNYCTLCGAKLNPRRDYVTLAKLAGKSPLCRMCKSEKDLKIGVKNWDDDTWCFVQAYEQALNSLPKKDRELFLKAYGKKAEVKAVVE